MRPPWRRQELPPPQRYKVSPECFGFSNRGYDEIHHSDKRHTHQSQHERDDAPEQGVVRARLSLVILPAIERRRHFGGIDDRHHSGRNAAAQRHDDGEGKIIGGHLGLAATVGIPPLGHRAGCAAESARLTGSRFGRLPGIGRHLILHGRIHGGEVIGEVHYDLHFGPVGQTVAPHRGHRRKGRMGDYP